jgi:hypothetical protein
MLTRYKLLVGFLLSFLSSTALAVPELTTVGQGTYRYLFWQLYDARLASRDGRFTGYQQSTPLLLELTYKRDISVRQFIDATVDEWRRLKRSTAVQHKLWSQLLERSWRDVAKGDTLAALLLPDGTVTFYLNGTVCGSIEDPTFGPAFFDIWLHPDTRAPKLRRQLIAAQ